MAKLRKVRWGRLRELDRRIHVGTKTFNALPLRLRHLSSWRRMHKVAGGHMPIRMFGTRHKVRPSSNLRLSGRPASKLGFLRKKGDIK